LPGRGDGSGCWTTAGSPQSGSWPRQSGYSYVGRILRLTLLAPDIVERILDGRRAVGLTALLNPFQVDWKRQRQGFC
jgi:hypothetical protein